MKRFFTQQSSADRQEDKCVEELLERLRGLAPLEDEPEFIYDRSTLTRFLRARSWNVVEAEKQLRTTVEWRRKHKPLMATCGWCERHPGRHSMRQIGFDNEGRPVVYSCFAQASTQSISAQEAVEHCVYILENAAKSMRPGVSNWIFVLDCSGITPSSCHPRLGYECCETMGRYYPERLYKVFCVNHNALFKWVWGALKKVLPQETAAKVNLISKKRLLQVFQDNFPEEVSQWLLSEIQLNRDIRSLQRNFWLAPSIVANDTPEDGDHPSRPSECEQSVHDPRGTPSYVAAFVADPKSSISELTTHKPHPNILLCSLPSGSYLTSQKVSSVPDMGPLDPIQGLHLTSSSSAFLPPTLDLNEDNLQGALPKGNVDSAII